MAREAWIASRERRRVSHLLVVTEAEAKAARARIEAGEPFDKVAAAVSTDPSAAQNRGDLGWIKRDQMVAPFAQAVFAAKGGDLCGPFRTEFGWHLAKVHEVQTADPAEFERTKAAVITEMQTGVEAQKKPAVLKGLRSEYPLMVDSAVLDRDRTTSPAPGDESLVAGRIAGTTISLRELKLFLAEGLRMAGSSHGLGPETKKQFMEILADDYRIAAAAEKQGLAKRADVKATVRDLERRFAYEAFAQTWIDAHRPGDEALRRHHADHPDRFCGAGSLQLHLLAFDDPARAAQAQTEAERGVSFQALLPKYANAASTGDWDAGWVEADRLRNVMDPRTMEALLGAKPGALVGPAPGPEGLMLFKVVGRKPGAPRPFEEVREAVRADYLASEGPALVARYLDGEGRQGIKVETFPANAGTPATK
jgi:parvulin-like peptidyl-prolyl isomerase